jgi:hypothetical protein
MKLPNLPLTVAAITLIFTSCTGHKIQSNVPATAPVHQTETREKISSLSVGNDLIPRTYRDGANQITFIDLTQPLPKDGTITSWSFYAQKYANGVTSTDPRTIRLLIFRNVDGGYKVIGQSPYFTVTSDGWDRVHSIKLADPIEVEHGDLIGWYYPNQGNSPLNGGVIAFQEGSPNQTVYRWNQLSGDPNEQPPTMGGVINPGQFTGFGEGRKYSIQVNEE